MLTKMKMLLAGLLMGVASITSCGGTNTESIGEAQLAIVLQGGIVVNTVSYTVMGAGLNKMGTIDVSHSSTISAVLSGLPAAGPDTIALSATSIDSTVTCSGTSAPFFVTAHQTAVVSVVLDCHQAAHSGSDARQWRHQPLPRRRWRNGRCHNPADTVAVGISRPPSRWRRTTRTTVPRPLLTTSGPRRRALFRRCDLRVADVHVQRSWPRSR